MDKEKEFELPKNYFTINGLIVHYDIFPEIVVGKDRKTYIDEEKLRKALTDDIREWAEKVRGNIHKNDK